ncbi:MAG: hypothetical protein LBQ66_16195 [Planctomycetaceae bacterium]|nr:hypothetical protein [Planctomycetaceae bacterium]
MIQKRKSVRSIDGIRGIFFGVELVVGCSANADQLTTNRSIDYQRLIVGDGNKTFVYCLPPAAM